VFKLLKDKVTFADYQIQIPSDFVDKPHSRVFGTATCGLRETVGYVISKKENLAEIRISPTETVQAVLIDNIEPAHTVKLREQLDVETGQPFWLAFLPSRNLGQLNWINISYQDGKLLRICPFTFNYKVLEI